MGKRQYRSSTTTSGRNMAGARALWRATGFTSEDFRKPIIAIANSFTQFVPGHVHLHPIGQMVKEQIAAAGGVGVEFNTIAVDDGIAMGHDGMLYSLPSRDLIADSVEYMVNAHQADALYCISNCDKITPGMLMAAMRLNIPTIFVSGGPMEAGVVRDGEVKVDLIDAMVAAGDARVSDELVQEMEEKACPTCGSCSGMFTANSMNCLNEAIGLALPGNGTVLATHSDRKRLFEEAAARIVEMAVDHYENGNQNILPRNIATKAAFENAMSLDVAMGGSTNTVLHILAMAREGGVDFTMKDIDRISRNIPTICKVAPSSHHHIEDVHRAGGIYSILAELAKQNKIDTSVYNVTGMTLADALEKYEVTSAGSEQTTEFYKAAPGGERSATAFSQGSRFHELDLDREKGCIRSVEHAYSQDGGLCVLYGNIAEDGCIVKTAGVDEKVLEFRGRARIFHSQDTACEAILADQIVAGDVVVIRYEGPKGGPGMQEMLYPTSYIKSKSLGDKCALITDGRFSGGTSGLSIGHISPEAAAGGAVGLIEEGDSIYININKREITLEVSAEELAARRRKMQESDSPWDAGMRPRQVSKALQAYALMATSAATGAVRDVDALKAALADKQRNAARS